MLFNARVPVPEFVRHITKKCEHNVQLVNNTDHFINLVINPTNPAYIVCAELEHRMGYPGLYSGNSTCEMCQFVTGIVRYEVLKVNATLAVIEDIIKVICATQPFIKKECDFYLDSTQEVIDWIVAGLSDEHICEKLGMCS